MINKSKENPSNIGVQLPSVKTDGFWAKYDGL